MGAGWWHRAAGVLGTGVLTVLAVLAVNQPAVQHAFALVPFFGNPAPVVLGGGDLGLVVSTTVAVVVAALWPLYKPRPRRILDTIVLTQKRVLLATLGLATLGYFKWSHRLPRSTLMLATGVLLVGLPLWFLFIRRQPTQTARAIIVGDEPGAMQDILAATEASVLGYVSPPSSYVSAREASAEQVSAADGGVVEPRLEALPCLGGLSRLDDVLVDHDVDTVLLAFAETDRGEFFGTLDACADHGVRAKVHRDHADDVLTAQRAGGELLAVDLEPWDWQDYIIKRAFDIAFAGVGLVVLSPVIAAIAIAIKLDDGGAILYGQERTALFGETFTVYKFRSMRPADEECTPEADESDRVTRVGRVLRKTHLDEIPQLWAILTGKMSVVGPRAVWTDEELHLEAEASDWRKRWFVKPGLTGLAQINDVTSAEAEAKLRYDLEYIRQQSVWFDVKIVVRQIWQVVIDVLALVTGRSEAA
ncbi:MAG: sugar transferase [Haloarculaceae archaeon]